MLAPSSSGLGRLVLIQKIAGSNPAGVTKLDTLKIMMLKLAINYSQFVTELTPQELNYVYRIDYIKLSRQDKVEKEAKLASKIKPCLLHYLPPLGQSLATWEKFDFDQLNRLVALTRCPYVSVHLDAYLEKLGNLDRPTLLKTLLDNYRFIAQKISVPLMVENVDFAPFEGELSQLSRLPWVYQSDFISDFLAKSTAKLVLDLAHCRCAAAALRQDTHYYLSALPRQRVHELHVSGPHSFDGKLVDAHYALEKVDYELLEYTLQQLPKVRMLTLEYGGDGPLYNTPAKNDPTKIIYQLNQLWEIRSRYHRE